jgi:hypothetical protein
MDESRSIEVTHYYLMSTSVCFMKLGAPTFGAYRFTIFYLPDGFVLFINIYCPSLSLLTKFGLRYILSNVSIAIPTYFQLPLACSPFFHIQSVCLFQ